MPQIAKLAQLRNPLRGEILVRGQAQSEVGPARSYAQQDGGFPDGQELPRLAGRQVDRLGGFVVRRKQIQQLPDRDEAGGLVFQLRRQPRLVPPPVGHAVDKPCREIVTRIGSVFSMPMRVPNSPFLLVMGHQAIT